MNLGSWKFKSSRSHQMELFDFTMTDLSQNDKPQVHQIVKTLTGVLVTVWRTSPRTIVIQAVGAVLTASLPLATTYFCSVDNYRTDRGIYWQRRLTPTTRVCDYDGSAGRDDEFLGNCSDLF